MLYKAEKKERKTPSPFGKGLVNQTNLQATEWLKGVHPKYAKHIWERNGLVQAISMEKFGGVDVLSLPVCERCEKPGAWHDDDSCYCFPCGHKTSKENTKTLYRYIAEDSMPHGVDKEAMELLNKMLIPTFSGALADMFNDIDNLENSQYATLEGEEPLEFEETIDTFDIDESEDTNNETIETRADNNTLSDGQN